MAYMTSLSLMQTARALEASSLPRMLAHFVHIIHVHNAKYQLMLDLGTRD